MIFECRLQLDLWGRRSCVQVELGPHCCPRLLSVTTGFF